MEFFKLSSLKIYIAGLLLIILSGCSIFQPFVDRRRNPGVSDVNKLYKGQSKPDAPVICYNPLWTNEQEIQQMAENVCITEETGDTAELIDKSYFDGKLLLPVRAYFKCVKTGMDNVENTDNIEEQKNESATGK
jgi:hypothetical protein